jgi:integrase
MKNLTRGIYESGGRWHVDKWIKGRRLRRAFGDKESAERWLRHEGGALLDGHPVSYQRNITFAEAAAQYLQEKVAAEKVSADTDGYLMRSLLNHIPAETPLEEICDQTFSSWKRHKTKSGKSASSKTIREGISLVQSILKRAHKHWRVPGTTHPVLPRLPELELPPLENQRRPQPITWSEQDRLMAELPTHLQDMLLFAVHTGAREDVVCNLRWDWIIELPHIDLTCAVIPRKYVKGRKEDRVLVFNSEAKNVVARQEGKHAERVFTWRKPQVGGKHNDEPVNSMNNTSWVKARERAGLPTLRVHDLRHTFATRLGAAGVDKANIKRLMWHSPSDVTGRYMDGLAVELREAVERLTTRPEANDLTLLGVMLLAKQKQQR